MKLNTAEKERLLAAIWKLNCSWSGFARRAWVAHMTFAEDAPTAYKEEAAQIVGDFAKEAILTGDILNLYSIAKELNDIRKGLEAGKELKDLVKIRGVHDSQLSCLCAIERHLRSTGELLSLQAMVRTFKMPSSTIEDVKEQLTNLSGVPFPEEKRGPRNPER